MNIRLATEGPLDVPATLARYRLWGEDPANRFDGQTFRRILRIESRCVPYEVRWSGPIEAVRLEVAAPARGNRLRDAIVREVRSIFGLDFDLPAFYRMAKADPALAGLVEPLYGLRPTLTPNPLEMLVGAITAQQLNLTFAFTLRARLVHRYGTAVDCGGTIVWAFPTADVLAAARPRTLRAMQYSTSKAVAIRGAARALRSGVLTADSLETETDTRVIERLTALYGLGRWTADWFLARCMGRGAVCPAGDLAVRKAFVHYYGRGRLLTENAIRRRARAWGEYQNLAVHYLLAGMRLARPRAGGAA